MSYLPSSFGYMALVADPVTSPGDSVTAAANLAAAVARVKQGTPVLGDSITALRASTPHSTSRVIAN